MTTTKTTAQVSGVSCTPVMGPSPFAVAGVSPTEGSTDNNLHAMLALAQAECAKLRRNVEHYTALSTSLGALVRELEAKIIDKDRTIETLRRATVRAVWGNSVLRKYGNDEEGGAA